MPTVHRRIGLIADEPVEAALGAFRDRDSGEQPAAATAARAAVLQGAVLEAIDREARSGGANSAKANEILKLIDEILPSLGMPEHLSSYLASKLDQALEKTRRAERRARQLALLQSPDPYDEIALSIAEDFDELDLELED